MDRSDNPGNVERELDETPVENLGDRGTGMDRDAMQGGGSVEREGMQGTPATERENTGGGGSVEREGMQGGGVEREGMQGGSIDRDVMEGRGNDGTMPATGADGGTSDTMMRASQREGGAGYDRPVDTTPARDMDPADRASGGDPMHGSSPTDARSERSIGDQGRKTTGEGISRDW